MDQRSNLNRNHPYKRIFPVLLLLRVTDVLRQIPGKMPDLTPLSDQRGQLFPSHGLQRLQALDCQLILAPKFRLRIR